MYKPKARKRTNPELADKLQAKHAKVLERIEELQIEIQEVNTNYAEGLILGMFNSFKNGGSWIVHTILSSRNSLNVVSPVGRVRHLWGYLNTGFSIQSAQDRRGPNSSIQGYASDIGFMAAKQIQDVKWNLFTSKGRELSLKMRNAVHDALYSTVRLEEFPIAVYLLEHAMTTLTHRKLLDTYDHPLLVGLETDLEVGAHWGALSEWDYSAKSLVSILNNVMEEQEKIFKRPYDKKERKKIIAHSLHNYEAVKALWIKEINYYLVNDKKSDPKDKDCIHFKESRVSMYCSLLDDYDGDFEAVGFKLV